MKVTLKQTTKSQSSRVQFFETEQTQSIRTAILPNVCPHKLTVLCAQNVQRSCYCWATHKCSCFVSSRCVHVPFVKCMIYFTKSIYVFQ